MKMIMIMVNDIDIWYKVNYAIRDTYIQLSMTRTYLTYEQACKLCKIATDDEHDFIDDVQDVLHAIVRAWEFWNNPGYSKTWFENDCGYAEVIGD